MKNDEFQEIQIRYKINTELLSELQSFLLLRSGVRKKWRNSRRSQSPRVRFGKPKASIYSPNFYDIENPTKCTKNDEFWEIKFRQSSSEAAASRFVAWLFDSKTGSECLFSSRETDFCWWTKTCRDFGRCSQGTRFKNSNSKLSDFYVISKTEKSWSA